MPLISSQPEGDRSRLLLDTRMQLSDGLLGVCPQLQLIQYDPIVKLLRVLPTVGQALAKDHCARLEDKYPSKIYAAAKATIRRLADNPFDLIAHQPKWHQWSIPEHTQNVVAATMNLLISSINDQDQAVQAAVKHLQQQKLEGLSLFNLFLISIPLHDIGKYQPIIKPVDDDGNITAGHTGHEARSGDIIKLASSTNCPQHLQVVKDIFIFARLSAQQIEFIEQCARLHYEFGKIREIAKNSDAGFTHAFLASQEFTEVCSKIAKEHSYELGLIKGLYFLVDNAGKLDMGVTRIYTQLVEAGFIDAESLLEVVMSEAEMPINLRSAVQQFPVNKAVALAYLKGMF